MVKPQATVGDVMVEMNRAAANGDVSIHQMALSSRLQVHFDVESIAPAINKAIAEGQIVQLASGFLKRT